MSTVLTDWLAYQLQARHCPGALVHVEQAGRTLARHAVGRIRPDDATPMHPGVRFRIASLTKPVVTVAALMLVDEGRLDLDAPVGELLPVLQGLRGPDGQAPQRVQAVKAQRRRAAGRRCQAIHASFS